MKYTVENSSKLGKRLKVYDCYGKRISFVMSYDNETKDIEVCVRLADSSFICAGENIAVFKGNLPGSYMTIDDEKIP